MRGFCILTTLNPTSDRALQEWLNQTHRPFLAAIDGLNALHVGKLSATQFLRSQSQPFSAMMLHDFTVTEDAPRIAAMEQALRTLPLKKDAPAPAFNVYGWKTGWVRSPDITDGPMPPHSHWSIGLANCYPGQEAAYHRWNDDHHVSDAVSAPGVVAMRRGQLSSFQFSQPPSRTGKFIGIVALDTDNAAAVLQEMKARNLGQSASGIRFERAPPTVVVPDTKTSVFDILT